MARNSPAKKAKNVPIIKNGANGTSLFSPFFSERTKPTPIIAPIMNDENKATTILGNPKKNPIKIANLTSPNPIQFPFETRKRERKKDEAPNPDKIIKPNSFKAIVPLKYNNNCQRKVIPMAVNTASSGIM